MAEHISKQQREENSASSEQPSNECRCQEYAADHHGAVP